MAELINNIETLPKSIEYNKETYYLNIHTNAWNNLVIEYSTSTPKVLERKSILAYCVERNNDPYIPKGFDTQEGGLNENIGNDRTLDKCIEHICDIISDENNKDKFILNY